MFKKRKTKKSIRGGFTILELSIALALIAIIYVAFIKSMQSMNEDVNVARELAFYNKMENAIKEGFVIALDEAETMCTNGVADSASSWGWNHANCVGSSPFPVYSSTGGQRLLRWNFNFSTPEGTELKTALKGIMSGFCTVSAETTTSIDFRCPKLLGIDYDMGGGFMPTAMLSGPRRIDPATPPTVRISFERINTLDKTGTAVTAQYTFSMTDVYNRRKLRTLVKMDDFRKVLTNVHNTKLAIELGNPPPNGLHSIDDEMAPWFWLSFSTRQISAIPKCNAPKCTNDNADWRNITGRAMPSNSVISTYLGSDSTYLVDGFGNEMYIYPKAGDCTGIDYMTCPLVTPPLPEADYAKKHPTQVPPFTSTIFINGYGQKTTTAKPFCRTLITY